MTKPNKNKTNKSILESLAANFDYALFDELVRQKENELRSEFPENSKSKRLYNLERQYKSLDTAYRILAEEKVRSQIRRKQFPDETEEVSKNNARLDTAHANAHRLIRRPQFSDDGDYPVTHPPPRPSHNWRNWGQS